MNTFLEARTDLKTDEWVDLLLVSAGCDPGGVTMGLADEAARRRRKLLFLARLAPLVAGSLILLELGPKNTGKTFLLCNLTPRASVISGGRATAAILFENLSSGRLGLLATRRVVVFDEVARLRFDNAEILGILKDDMESGMFGRGRGAISSDGSLVFTGNNDVDGDRPASRNRLLVEPLPLELRDSAFLDRVHGYLPGWELPKLGPGLVADGLGFVSDFFGEVLLKLRDPPFAKTWDELKGSARPLPDMTQRDVTAVERLSQTLGKLVFPLGVGPGDDAWAADLLRVAAEMRQLVHDQLCRLAPGEFRPRAVGWQDRPLGATTARAPRPLPPLRAGEVYLLGGPGTPAAAQGAEANRQQSGKGRCGAKPRSLIPLSLVAQRIPGLLIQSQDGHGLPEARAVVLRKVEVLPDRDRRGLAFGPGFDREARRAVSSPTAIFATTPERLDWPPCFATASDSGSASRAGTRSGRACRWPSASPSYPWLGGRRRRR